MVEVPRSKIGPCTHLIYCTIVLLYVEVFFTGIKYDGLENIEKPSPASEVTLGSSTDTNLGHNHCQKQKCMLEI